MLSHTLNQHCPCITPDSKTLVFHTYPGPGRLSSPELWRVNLDGSDLRPVITRPGLAGFVLSPDGENVYCQDGGLLLRGSIDGGELVEIGNADGIECAATVLGGITGDGENYVSTGLTTDGTTALLRYSTDGSGVEVLLTEPSLPHVQVEPLGEGRILFSGTLDQDGYGLRLLNIDGSNLRTLKMRGSTGHYSWFGTTGDVLSTVNEPFGSVAVIGEDDQEPQIVAKGSHYWHAAGSSDGSLIVSDTNWPILGLYLINTETGISAPLCHPKSSSGHPQWSHPHPVFSPDGRSVVFNSDRTEIGQIYVAQIPGELTTRLAS